jgi:hypothetical protein
MSNKVLVSQNLKFYGSFLTIVVRILLIMMVMYFVTGVSRVWGIEDTEFKSIVNLPFKMALTPNWGKVLKGRAWMDATLFVIHVISNSLN